MKQYTSILSAMRSQVWLLQPEKLQALVGFLSLKAQGQEVDADTWLKVHGTAELQAARAQKVTAASKGSVAVLPLYGLLLHRGMNDVSGPTAMSTARFLRQFQAAADDPGVQAIVIDVDSPGGAVEGVDEVATAIRATRGKKKTIAVSNMQCCSAAYYIAASCDEIVASPSSQTGSIGVYCVHEDVSEYLKNLGVKVTMIKFGENKAEGNPYEPLSEDALAHVQASVDEAGDMFEKAVALGRGITQKHVHDTFGQGLVFGAKQAKKIGMVDTVGTLDSVLARYGITNASPASGIDALLQAPELEASDAGVDLVAEDVQPDSAALAQVAIDDAAMRRKALIAAV